MVNDSDIGISSSNSLDVPMNVLPLSTLEIVYRLVAGVVGVFINLVIIVTVSVSRQLHYPRHIYWAGISVAYLTYIIQLFNDVLGNYFKSRIACQLYVLHATVPYTVLSFYLMIAACDRLLAITCYDWYERRVTNRRVIALLIFVYLVTLAGITSPFWTGYKELAKCTVNMTHMHYVMVVNVIIAAVCVCLHVKIFVVSRAVMRRYGRHLQPTVVKFTNNRVTSISSQAPRGMATGMVEMSQVHQSPIYNGITATTNKTECTHFWQMIFTRSPLNLEAKAALSLSINVLPMWLCHFPQAIFAFSLFWCLKLERECGSIMKINAIIKNFYFAYTFYNPLMYIVTSKEFHRAIGRLCKKKTTVGTNLSR